MLSTITIPVLQIEREERLTNFPEVTTRMWKDRVLAKIGWTPEPILMTVLYHNISPGVDLSEAHMAVCRIQCLIWHSRGPPFLLAAQDPAFPCHVALSQCHNFLLSSPGEYLTPECKTES